METTTRQDQPTATVEMFSTFCCCKPPRLDANDVCACGVAWGSA